MGMMMIAGGTIFILALCSVHGFGGNDRVRLSDITTLTLHHGKMTNGRRSSPVPQLKCVGGNAGCSQFSPQVVQCYNRGFDGYDVQWECKTDMDNAYRFGKVDVSCEGYDYAEDPDVLRGSCGLEYTLDLTKEGHEKQNSGHSYYGNDHAHNERRTYTSNPYKTKATSGYGDIITLLIVGVIIYALYKTCLGNVGTETPSDMPQGENPPPYESTPPPYGSAGNPPPYGFRDEYTGGTRHRNSKPSSSSYGSAGSYGSTGNGPMGGGFWSGAATGGILGYLFGNRNSNSYNNRASYGNSYGTGSSWGSGSSSWFSSPGSSSGYRSSGSSFGGGGSTGTRTASGFGGTTRR